MSDEISNGACAPLGVRQSDDRRLIADGTLGKVGEILIRLARAHNHPACAEIWPPPMEENREEHPTRADDVEAAEPSP